MSRAAWALDRGLRWLNPHDVLFLRLTLGRSVLSPPQAARLHRIVRTILRRTGP